MDALGLMNGDLTERDVTLCFSWSRMVVAEPRAVGGPKRDSCLPFEGFLESLCRLAGLKAFPTDEEIEAAGATDAADCLDRMRAEEEERYWQFVAQRGTPWGEEPRQPLARCVAHLCAVILRKLEGHFRTTVGDSSFQLGMVEAGKWVTANAGVFSDTRR